MWDDLLRVDWGRLGHAYGHALGVPKMLLDMVSTDEKARASGWDSFWGAVNHQGDYYDSTVAVIPFLIEAVGRPEVPERARILDALRELWLHAPTYGGDPMLDEPPGGVDEPTPMLADGEPAAIAEGPHHEDPDELNDEEFDSSRYRRMDLCAWQAGRAIRAGRATFERITDESDRAVAAAAAELLLLWPETRADGKRTLTRTIGEEPEPIEQTRRILELGVYGDPADAETFRGWVAPGRPGEVRAAAAIAWTWMVDPELPPGPAARALYDASADDCEAFARLPWTGVWHRGPWILPSNAAGLILRLAGNRNDELRWRAVQGLGLTLGRAVVKHLSDDQVIPVLIERLSDRDARVREAAALALAQRGGSVSAIDPGVVPALIRAADDADSSVCGHAARLLAAVSDRLTPDQRAGAMAGVGRAALRFAGRSDRYVRFDSMWTQAAPFLEKQRGPIQRPPEWGARELFAEIAFPMRQDGRFPLAECDRRLADAYADDPGRVLDAATEAMRGPGDRNAAIGAADWLATLGPAAAPALPALEAMSGRDDDQYVQERARSAIAFIRRSMLVAPDPGGVSPPGPIEALAHLESIVRARAANSIAAMPPGAPDILDAVPALLRLLDDEAFAEVGIAGRFEFQGRIHHWHLRRVCPRAEAIRALSHLGRVPDGDRMLRAMIAETEHAEVVCARRETAPHQFGIAAWRAAATAAGGPSVADPLIRAARRRCLERAHSREDADGVAFACETELDEVIRRFSGRLGGDP